jgi:RsiW-degrading membrane proteinase PrsW (M82 family)
MQIASYLLIVYAWIGIGVLILFLGRIAYFYEKTSGQSTGYLFLILPALLLTLGAVWYVIYDTAFTGQPVGDVLLFLGGVSLAGFGARLQEFMTGERR